MYMAIKTTTLPGRDNSGVKFIERPTVETADTASNNRCIKSCSSDSDKIIVVSTTSTIDITAIVSDLLITRGAIVRLKITVCSLFVTTVQTNSRMTSAVVVRIPPPAEPGEAPINISMIVQNWPVCD